MKQHTSIGGQPLAANLPKWHGHKTNLYLFVFLVFQSTCQLFGQQLSSPLWVLPDRVMQFKPGASTPVWERPFSSASSSPVNAASDADGNLLFYVRDYKLYNNKDEQLDVFPGFQNLTPPPSYLTSAGEVAIVPFIEPLSCIKHYYVFYLDVSDYGELKLRAKIVTVNINSDEVTVVDYQANGVSKIIATEPYQISNPWLTIMRFGGLAVSAVYPEGVRYLYLVSGSRVQKVTIGNPNAPDYGIGPVSTIYSNTGLFTTHQAQLSADGTKLLWGVDGGTLQLQTSYSIYYVLSLDNKGNAKMVNGFPEARTFALGMPNGMYYQVGARCRGVSFNADATKIFVTTGTVAPGDNGIWVWDIGSGLYSTYATGRYISSTTPFAVSQLQLAPDGRIYALSNQQLIAINTNTESIAQVWSINGVNNSVIQYLPDQINSEKTEQIAPAFPDVLINSSTVIDGNATGHVLRVKRQMKVSNSGTVLTLRNLTVEFGTNGSLNVEPGATVVLQNCTLKGFSINGCESDMWEGIRVNGNGVLRAAVQLNPNALETEKVIIRDARMGIKASGPLAEITGFSSLFTANEMGIVLEAGGYFVDFMNNTFDGETPLIDQRLGSDNGYYDGKKRSIYGIYSTSGVGVTRCVFVGGQYGILAGLNSIGIGLCTFHRQREVAVSVGNILTGVASINVSQNTFNDAQNGIEISAAKRASVYISGNTFNNMREYGIDAHDNNGGLLYIGQYTGTIGSSGRANQFNGCRLAAIYMHNNAQYKFAGNPVGTEIYIHGNSIVGNANLSIDAVYQDNTGILLTESTGGGRKYKSLSVKGNVIKDIRCGVYVTNMNGGNPQDPRIERVVNYPISSVRNNVITCINYGVNIGAISNNSSVGVSIHSNTIWTQILKSRYAIAISVANANNMLIGDNLTYTGLGILGRGGMTNSNYYCNQFMSAYEGVRLESHKLRDVTGLHGLAGQESRHNYFFNRPVGAVDIHLSNSQTHRNFWVFTQNQPPHVIKYTSCSGPIPYINVALAPNVCGVTSYPDNPTTGDVVSVPDINTDGVSGFMDAYYYEQQRTMGYTSGAIAYPSLATLIEVENLISDGEHLHEAYEKVRDLTFSALPLSWQNIMADYKMLYETYLSYKLHATSPRSMPQPAVDILSAIAAKNAITVSPAAYSARAILWDERQLFFSPEVYEPELILAGEIGPLCSVADKAGLTVTLLNALGQPVKQVLTDTAGMFIFPANTVNLTETNATYRLALALPNGTWLYSPFDTYHNLCLQSDWVLDCSTNLGKKQLEPIMASTALSDEAPFTVYPNPSYDGYFTVTGVPAYSRVTVTDITGKTLLANITLLNGQLVLNQLSAGIYLIKVNANNHTYENKICIIK